MNDVMMMMGLCCLCRVGQCGVMWCLRWAVSMEGRQEREAWSEDRKIRRRVRHNTHLAVHAQLSNLVLRHIVRNGDDREVGEHSVEITAADARRAIVLGIHRRDA